MSTVASTPSSSSTTPSSSSLTRTPPPTSSSSAAQRQAEASTEQNSCYFPGCRKDTNCNCDICLASINATLDLIPHSSRSSLTKLSSSSSARRHPLFGPEKTPPAQPKKKPISTHQSPPSQSTAKSWPIKERVVAEKATAMRTKVLVVLTVFSLFLIVDKGVSQMVFWRGFEPKLKGDILSEGLVGELRERIGIVQRRTEDMIHERVVDCSSMKLGWEFHQEGQNFFHWKCVIYKSWVEEVSIWGSPLRSSGLLPTAFSPRALSVVSGKITEWSDGKVMSIMRTSNSSSSWTLKPWNKSVMQLEANTWVLEYKSSAWLEGQGLLEFAGEMVRLKNLKMMLAQQGSLFFSVHKQTSEENLIPT